MNLFSPLGKLSYSLNNLIFKGQYNNDLRKGEWIERYSEKGINNEIKYFYFKSSTLLSFVIGLSDVIRPGEHLSVNSITLFV